MDPAEEEQLGIDPEQVLAGWSRPVFLIHHHLSKHEHYDLRLEIDGVLKSWAVPKGLSNEIGVKRLARQVEDHALSYAAFEGSIPEGHRGAGEVRIWDKGNFSIQHSSPGELKLTIHADRTRGTYRLVATRMTPDAKSWLIWREA